MAEGICRQCGHARHDGEWCDFDFVTMDNRTCACDGGQSHAPIDTDPVGRPGQQQGDHQWPDTTCRKDA